MDELNIPLYQKLVAEISKKIKNEYQANDKLPSERDIMQEFGVSRNTVRQALAELEQTGEIYRQHGKGTYVAQTNDQSVQLGEFNNYSFTEQMKAAGRHPETKILSFKIEPSNEMVSENLNIKLHQNVVRIKRLRSADGSPMMLERTYLPASKFPDFDITDLQHNALYSVFEEKYGQLFYQADEQITAGILNFKEGNNLEVPPGSPCLRIKRVTLNQKKEKIEFTLSAARADQFIYEVHYER